MNGYEFMLERNRLLVELEHRWRRADGLPEDQKATARAEARTGFTDALARRYSELDICIWKASTRRKSG